MSDLSNDEWDKSLYTQDYIIGVYCYVSLLVMIVIVIIFMRALYMYRKQNAQSGDTQQIPIQTQHSKDIEVITKTTIASIVIYLLSQTLFAVILTKWVFIEQEHGNPLNKLIYTISATLWALNNIGFLFFILLRRLDLVNPTKSKYIRTLSYVIPIALFTIVVAPPFIIQTVTKTATYSGVWASVCGMLVWMGYVVVVIVFFKMTSKVMRHRLIDILRKTENVDDTESQRDEMIVTFETVNDAVRYAVLLVIHVTSNFLLLVCAAISFALSKHETHQNTLVIAGFVTDSICNTVCLCLMFRFMNRSYDAMCGSCHQCVFSCCINNVANNYTKENQKFTVEEYKNLITK